jgi:iron complex outermembrane receptor protein
MQSVSRRRVMHNHPPRLPLSLSTAQGGWVLIALSLLLPRCLPAAAGEALSGDLTEMSLEALMDMEVTSVSKKPEKQSAAAAAVFVISNDDLRRWGVTNIPDALRRVPGLQVARIDPNKWAISSRGFNGRFANKLLVMIDGRTVYTPLFAGVYWDMQDVMLEDVDRIEIIRGPGGTLWGANAVNGVINIITKPAMETQGNLLAGTLGNEINGIGAARHGGTLQNGAGYRVYARYSDYDKGHSEDHSHDDWHIGQTGFRGDWQHNERNTLTLQGDYYQGKSGEHVMIATGPAGPPPTAVELIDDDTDMEGGNLLFRWSHTHDSESEFVLQTYFDYVDRREAVLNEERSTIDVDLQHQVRLHERHEILWGIGYRHTNHDSRRHPSFRLVPENRDIDLYSAFIQDSIELDESVLLTIGSKFEHNDFTGFEYQPSARVAWTRDDNQTLWAAVSRAVRTPSLGEHDVRLRLLPDPDMDTGIPVYAAGDDDFDSEDLIAWELGYRLNRHNRWSVDIASFYNRYDNLRTLETNGVTPEGILLPFDNRMDGETWGIEIAGQWQVRQGWRINGSYTWLNMSLDPDANSVDTQSPDAENASPSHQASVWSSWNPHPGWELDGALRYVGDVEVTGVKVDDYVELDLRIGWQAAPGVELSLTGQNLLDNHHQEYLPDFIATLPTEVERSIFFRAAWEF